jgi:hypothetical protein
MTDPPEDPAKVSFTVVTHDLPPVHGQLLQDKKDDVPLIAFAAAGQAKKMGEEEPESGICVDFIQKKKFLELSITTTLLNIDKRRFLTYIKRSLCRKEMEHPRITLSHGYVRFSIPKISKNTYLVIFTIFTSNSDTCSPDVFLQLQHVLSFGLLY